MRNTANDVDDDFDFQDPESHMLYIDSKLRSFHRHSSCKMQVLNEALEFISGIYDSFSLHRLMKPTLKGFWVPIKVKQGASLTLSQMIGTANCEPHVSGMLIFGPGLRSFDLITLTQVNQLILDTCERLKDLSGMPMVTSHLSIASHSVANNIVHIVNACSPLCLVTTDNKDLERLLNRHLRLKHTSMSNKKIILNLQQELIEHDLEEFSTIRSTAL